MTGGEMKRWLASLGATFAPAKGSHVRVSLKGKRTILPLHGKKELRAGTERAIKKQLGLK